MQFKIKGILSYPHLFTPRAAAVGDEPKYSASILVRKDDPQVQNILNVIEAEKRNGWPTGFPPNGKIFLKDCAVTNPGEPALANYYAISTGAKADSKPHVVGMDLQPIIDPSQVFAGAVVYAALNSFVYNHQMNKGVGAGLNGICVTNEEPPLGRLDGRPSVDGMFGDVVGGAAPAYGAPPAAAAPAYGAPPAAPAPVAPTPAPMAPPAAPAPAPAAPAYVMTAAANGLTREAYLAAGWTDAQLVQNGLMIAPSFA